MSAMSQLWTFSLGTAVGVGVATALFWARSGTSRPNGFEKLQAPDAPAEPVPDGEAATAEEAKPVAPEDRPADAPESCPGVSSDVDGMGKWK